MSTALDQAVPFRYPKFSFSSKHSVSVFQRISSCEANLPSDIFIWPGSNFTLTAWLELQAYLMSTFTWFRPVIFRGFIAVTWFTFSICWFERPCFLAILHLWIVSSLVGWCAFSQLWSTRSVIPVAIFTIELKLAVVLVFLLSVFLVLHYALHHPQGISLNFCCLLPNLQLSYSDTTPYVLHLHRIPHATANE